MLGSIMNTQSNSINPVVVYHGPFILCDTGKLIEEPLPVHFAGWKVLGALIVFDDKGLLNREIVLVREKLKGINDPSFFLRRVPFRVDDLKRVADFLKDWLEQLIKHAVTEVGFDHYGVHYIVLGYVSEHGQYGLAISSSELPPAVH